MDHSWIESVLRCPETRQALKRVDNGWITADGRQYPDCHGIYSLNFPRTLTGSDMEMNRRYEWLAPFYDVSERFLGRILTGVNMARGRERIIELSPLEKGMTLLEVSPGPGVFHPLLREKTGHEAEAIALDLSISMLFQCKKRHPRENFTPVHGNAQHLPFADQSFDALFHFGGVNLFNSPEAALDEFVRVIRPGGILIWGDEKMSPEFQHPVGRRVLPKMNPGFLKTPPKLPMGISNIVEHTVYDGLGYLVTCQKSE